MPERWGEGGGQERSEHDLNQEVQRALDEEQRLMRELDVALRGVDGAKAEVAAFEQLEQRLEEARARTRRALKAWIAKMNAARADEGGGNA